MPSSRTPRPLTCPRCGGVLAEASAGGDFCCAHGHAFTGPALEQALTRMLRRNLQTFLRQLHERQHLLTRMAEHGLRAPALEAEGVETRELAQTVLRTIAPHGPAAPPDRAGRGHFIP